MRFDLWRIVMPTRSPRLLISLLIISLMVFVVGCPKKPPPEPVKTTPPPVAEKPAPAVEVPNEKEGGFQQTEEKPSPIEEADSALAKLNAQKVLGTIYFDYDKSDLRSDALAQLKKNAEWLKANPKYRVRLEGNCDERGTVEYNLALGDRRAAGSKNYLLKAGVDASRLETISYGEEHPVDPGHNEDAWQKNRRVDFVLVK
jgi:peptidoglycan-associated lipoprotein